MRIKQIKIDGLFGMFNHTINLHRDGLTIIYGENGIGKTMIFKLIKDLFKETPSFYYNFTEEHHIEKITILFDDDTIVELANIHKLSELVKFPAINVALIETQRLIYVQKHINRRKDGFLGIVGDIKPLEEKDITFSIQSVVNKYANELAHIFKKVNEEYKELSDTLKNSQNDRLERNEINTDLSEADFIALVNEIQDRRAALREVGILENGVGKIEIPQDPLRRAILAVNMQDVLTQLKMYDEDNFYARVHLFVTILNERRLSYKKIILSEKKGFVFENNKGVELKAAQLSSGEQHEVALLYQLLFKIPDNSLILIDEPEISLHAAWQIEFLTDMQDIIKLRGFDMLIATHSPSIINGNWDLTVSLEGGTDGK